MDDVRSAAQKFAEISPIHGCSYIANRANLLDAAFWVVALIVCFAFAISDTITLVASYQAGETTISMRMQRDATLSLNASAVCFDVCRQTVGAHFDVNFNEPLFNQTLAHFNFSQLSLNDSNVDLLFKTAYLYVASIVDYDIGLNSILGYPAPPLPPTAKRAMALAVPFFTGVLNVSIFELMDQTARYMCAQITHNSVGAQLYCTLSACTPFDICADAAVQWFGPTLANINNFDDICFSLTNRVSPLFDRASDSIWFQAVHQERASMPPAIWEDAKTMNALMTPSDAQLSQLSVNVDVRGGEALLDFQSRDGLMSCGVDTQLSIGVEIGARFLALNQTRSPCQTDSQVRCALKCLIAKRVSSSGCVPLAAASLVGSAPQAPFCAQAYSDAQMENASLVPPSVWATCFNQTCSMPPCVTVSYDYKLISLNAAVGAGSSLTLVQARFVYAMMTEKLTVDFPAFLASFGGILGLWFGGSLIALAHVPSFICLKFLHYYLQRRRRLTSSPVPDGAGGIGPQQRDGIVYL